MAPHRQDNRDPEPPDTRAPQERGAMPPSAAIAGAAGPAPSGAGVRAATVGNPGSAAPGASVDPQFLQLRVRVEGAALRVVDARLLHGRLAREAHAGPGYAYEVTVAGRRLAVGSLPDLSLRRSYGDPSGPAERRGHHLTTNPHQEFAVRLASDEVARDELAALEVTLYEVPSQMARTPQAASLRSAGPAVRRIAHLPPDWLTAVPDQTRRELEDALRG